MRKQLVEVEGGIIEAGRVYDITYECRDIGYGVESDIGVLAFWNGDVDMWGKLTIQPVNGETLYLFQDEIVSVDDACANGSNAGIEREGQHA